MRGIRSPSVSVEAYISDAKNCLADYFMSTVKQIYLLFTISIPILQSRGSVVDISTEIRVPALVRSRIFTSPRRSDPLRGPHSE
jgi:hypothetical protein